MRGPVIVAAAVVLSATAPVLAASDSTTRTITAQAQVSSRTSLTVSSRQLQFTVVEAGQPASASIDFVAGIRTQAGAEVMLTVETVAVGSLSDESRITFARDGEEGAIGSMSSGHPAVAARWLGSGRRTGRIAFALHGAAPGTYTIPLRVVLSAP